jgi:RecG-like helicase/REP element-mobilizing transposase RayT
MLSDYDQRQAISAIDFPETWAERDAARRHLVLSEFFAMQMMIGSRKVRAVQKIGGNHCGAGKLLDRFLKVLPFGLTAAQERVLEDLRRDLNAAHPMNRLLQGDVGSGKTVVATAGMLLAVEAGYQAALMAPTQVLAEQHYDVLRPWLEPLGIRLALRTGARQEETGPLPLFEFGERENEGRPGSARVSRVGNDVSSLRTSDHVGKKSDAQYRQRRLPHFEKPWAIYAVTVSTKQRRVLSPQARTIVLNAIKHFHNDRFELFAACVMPDHVHLLLQPWPRGKNDDGTVNFWPLGELLKSIKSFSAHQINKLEETKGSLWEKERFDRYIRSDRDLDGKFHYILNNPWTAGIIAGNEDYPWVWATAGLIESPSRRDDATNTRDACATRNFAPQNSGQPHIIIGTHALLYESVSFSNLGFVVIDEQHKFGVAQRARLTGREPAPDVLVMTATPIPRTLTMTVYGDLDVSVIDEMPRNRGKIVTAVRDNAKLPEVLAFIRTQLEAGRQLYVIYPLIEESEKLDVKAAAVEFEEWRHRLHPFACELLHGRVPADEKQGIMERFRRGDTRALISTTVIEVGIDVPNATVMLIENAERFGLAQLHQLRGRIGRGEHKSYCVLLTTDQMPETVQKLNVLENTSNGFEIADADWEMRGPGDLLGTAQSGLPPLKLGNLRRDFELMQIARTAALDILGADPQLKRPQNQRFRPLTVEHEKTFSNVS